MTHPLSPSTEAVLTTRPPRKSELAAPRAVFGLMWPSSDFSKICISLKTSKSEYFNLFFSFLSHFWTCVSCVCGEVCGVFGAQCHVGYVFRYVVSACVCGCVW